MRSTFHELRDCLLCVIKKRMKYASPRRRAIFRWDTCHATLYNMQGGNAFINFSNIRPDANALGIRISVVLSILYGIGVFDE